MSEYKCCRCKSVLDGYSAYEYRGFVACETHFDEVIKLVDAKRADLIEREASRLKPIAGLDIHSDSPVGVVNQRILGGVIEAVSKEHPIEAEYRKGIL